MAGFSDELTKIAVGPKGLARVEWLEGLSRQAAKKMQAAAGDPAKRKYFVRKVEQATRFSRKADKAMAKHFDELTKLATARYVKNVAKKVLQKGEEGFGPAMDRLSPGMQGRVGAKLLGSHFGPRVFKQRPGHKVRYVTRQFKKGRVDAEGAGRMEERLAPRPGPAESMVPLRKPNLPR